MKILVVDNERLICCALKMYLERHTGSRVLCSNSGDEALRMMEEERFDAVITDLGLPDITGAELVRRIKGGHRDVPVIAITGLLNLDAEEINELGVFRCIYKPFRISEVVETLREALDATPVTGEGRAEEGG